MEKINEPVTTNKEEGLFYMTRGKQSRHLKYVSPNTE